MAYFIMKSDQDVSELSDGGSPSKSSLCDLG